MVTLQQKQSTIPISSLLQVILLQFYHIIQLDCSDKRDAGVFIKCFYLMFQVSV